MNDVITDVSEKPEGTVVRLEGEIDLHHSPELHQRLAQICVDKPPRLVVNLSKVSYIDSSGIGSLVEIYRRIKKDGGKLVLVSPSERVQSVLEITRLDQFFTMADSEQEALLL